MERDGERVGGVGMLRWSAPAKLVAVDANRSAVVIVGDHVLPNEVVNRVPGQSPDPADVLDSQGEGLGVPVDGHGAAVSEVDWSGRKIASGVVPNCEATATAIS